MKIWMSKRSEKTGKRHVVLDMSVQEDHESFWVLRREVMQGRGRAPKRRVMSDGRIRYRFARQHLQRLLMTFPFAELSGGIDRRARRANTHEQLEVPDIDLPDFKGELYDYQKIGVQAILDHWLRELDEAGVHTRGGFMLNDEMGLGKTIMAIAAVLKELAVPALVMCPNSAKWVWLKAIAKFTELEGVVADGTVDERLAAIEKRADFTIVNIEMLQKDAYAEALDFDYAALITDEFHRFANPKAKQTENWLKLHAARELLMSGTPILNRPEESWSGLHRLYPRRYPNHWAFKRWIAITSTVVRSKPVLKDGMPELNYAGRPKVKVTKYTKVVGYKPESMIKLRDHIQSPEVSIRRRKDHVLSDLPEVVFNTLLIELTSEQRRLYRQIVEEMRMQMDDGTIRTLTNMLAVVTRAKQACFSPELYGGTRTSAKLEELHRVVRELTDNDEKAIIFSQWSRATRIIQRELAAYNPAYVDGSVKGKKRGAQEDMFNNDPKCQLYIGTIRANREAISLGAATYVVFTDKDWTPMVNDQAIGRSAAGGLRGAHLGGDATVNVIELFAHNTVEERIEGLLASKRNLFNALYEKDGGAQMDRVTINEIADLF